MILPKLCIFHNPCLPFKGSLLHEIPEWTKVSAITGWNASWHSNGRGRETRQRLGKEKVALDGCLSSGNKPGFVKILCKQLKVFVFHPQPGYFERLAADAEVTKVPEVVLRIYADSHQSRVDHPSTFRNDFYKVIDDVNYMKSTLPSDSWTLFVHYHGNCREIALLCVELYSIFRELKELRRFLFKIPH